MTTTEHLEAQLKRVQTSAMGPKEASIAAHAREMRDAAVTKAARLVTGAAGQPTAAEEAAIAAALDAGDKWAQRADEFEARRSRRATNARIVREPLTYGPDRPESWLGDLWAARHAAGGAASERLERHGREMRVELAARERRFERRSRGDVIEDVTFEMRAPTGGAGQGLEFTPPLWLVDRYASVPRPERMLADLIGSYPLPSGVSSVNVPRLTTATNVQPTGGGAADPEGSWNDAVTSSQCPIISGHLDVPIAMLEQSGMGGAALDQVVWKDLLAAEDAALELQLVVGTGAPGPNGQLLGLLNVPGTGSLAYTSGSPALSGLYPLLGQAFGYVADNRKVVPQAWLLRGGRWAWIATSLDDQHRPIVPPSMDVRGPSDIADGLEQPIANLVGLPAFSTEAIPTNLGAGANQDTIVACRPTDLLLWEGEPRLSLFEQVLAGTNEVRIRMHTTVAFISGRYPTGICTVGGTGLTVAANE